MSDLFSRWLTTPDGTIWATGSTLSGDFPITGYSYQPNYQPGGDGYLLQIDPSMNGPSSLTYATYIGGSQQDSVRSVLVNTAGNVVLAGNTISDDLPVTPDGA